MYNQEFKRYLESMDHDLLPCATDFRRFMVRNTWLETSRLNWYLIVPI